MFNLSNKQFVERGQIKTVFIFFVIDKCMFKRKIKKWSWRDSNPQPQDP